MTEILEGNLYPKYLKVINDLKDIKTEENTTTPFVYNEYINTLYQAAKILQGSNKLATVSFKQNGEDKALIGYVSGEYIDNFIAVIMPVREDRRPKDYIPEYLSAS